MPCRAAKLCRQTAHSPFQSLWITDEILAEAWNRFARVSKAHTGRRYGSNVPGPLEAQRRLARRRMGLAAAVASGGPPPSFDLGGLFGLRGLGSERPGQFKWEPPGTKEVEKDDKAALLWFGRGPKRKDDTWAQFLDVPELEPPAESKQDPVEASRTAFEELLAKRGDMATIDGHDLQEAITFLQSSANEPQAHNTFRFVQWFLAQARDDTIFQALAELITDKVRLETLELEETSNIVASVALRKPDRQESALVTAILDAVVPGEALSKLLANITHRVLEQSIKDGQVPTELPAAVDRWLECLRQCKHLQSAHHLTVELQPTYELLAFYIPEISLFAGHLSTLKKADLARIALRHWASLMTTSIDAKLNVLEVTSSTTAKHLSPYGSGGFNVAAAEREYEELRLKRNKAAHSDARLRARGPMVLIDMLDVVRRQGASTSALAHGILTILIHANAHSPASIYSLVRLLSSRPGLRVDVSLAVRAIHHFLEVECFQLAYRLFEAIPSIPLGQCYKLPLVMAWSGRFATTKIWNVLQRQPPPDIVHASRREPTTPNNNLTRKHIDLIHLVARSVAASPHLRWRQAYRRIWECHLFLRDRSAPINSLLTRAMVATAVTRPLQLGNRISTMRFRYVLSIVSQVEGQEIAEQLDRVVWKLWTEKVLPALQEARRPNHREIAATISEAFGSPVSMNKALLHARRQLGLTGSKLRFSRFWLFGGPEDFPRRRTIRRATMSASISGKTNKRLEKSASDAARRNPLEAAREADACDTAYVPLLSGQGNEYSQAAQEETPPSPLTATSSITGDYMPFASQSSPLEAMNVQEEPETIEHNVKAMHVQEDAHTIERKVEAMHVQEDHHGIEREDEAMHVQEDPCTIERKVLSLYEGCRPRAKPVPTLRKPWTKISDDDVPENISEDASTSLTATQRSSVESALTLNTSGAHGNHDASTPTIRLQTFTSLRYHKASVTRKLPSRSYSSRVDAEDSWERWNLAEDESSYLDLSAEGLTSAKHIRQQARFESQPHLESLWLTISTPEVTSALHEFRTDEPAGPVPITAGVHSYKHATPKFPPTDFIDTHYNEDDLYELPREVVGKEIGSVSDLTPDQNLFAWPPFAVEKAKAILFAKKLRWHKEQFERVKRYGGKEHLPSGEYGPGNRNGVVKYVLR